MIYFGSQLSPNLTKTGEGFLYALNVPIARTGMQKYLPGEIPSEDVEDAAQYAGPDGLVPVYREPEAVFDPATIASFQGKPVADNHPNTPDNKIHADDIAFYGKGHMENVRRGTGDETDDLVADLVITDPALVRAVESGQKREVSCGYDCRFVAEGGKVYQRNIIGNHVAVVARGRAGSDVAIKDEKPDFGRRITVFNLSKRAIGTAIKEAVKDMEPEDAAELMHDHGEKTPAQDGAPAPAAPPAAAPAAQPNMAEEILKAIQALSAQISGMQKPAAEKSAIDCLEDATKDAEPDPKDPGEKSKSIGGDDGDNDENGKEATGDSSVLELVRGLKPFIAGTKDEAARDEMAKLCLKAVTGRNPAPSVYGQISQAVQTNKAKAAQDAAVPAQSIADRTKAFTEACKKAAEKKGE